jgi:cell division protein FtsZ
VDPGDAADLRLPARFQRRFAVKPAGKALDIVTVGLGQAGGNLAAEFARRGYKSLAFNTAATDLSSLSRGGLELPEEQRVYIGLEGHDGAGSDVSYGRECVTEHAGTIRERVAEHAEGADIVLLCCGLGGGTGSAVSELVTVLEDLSLPLMVLATLPSDHESGIAKVNAVRAVNELVKENLLGWIFADNSRLARAHGEVALNEYYTEINKVIVGPLHAFNLLNEREGVMPIRTLDGEDLRTLLLSGGILNFGEKQLESLTTDAVIEAVRDSAQYSTVMPEGFSLENVSYLGLVVEAPDSVLGATPFSFYEQISEQLKDETGGAAVYLGVYRNDAAEGATVRLLASSQAVPEGIQEMVTAAKREGAQLRDKLQQTLTGLDLGEIEEYELLRTSPGATRSPRRRIPEQRPSSAPRKPFRPSAPPADAPRASVAPESQDGNSSGDKPKDRPSAAEPQTSIAPPGATTADRETYDQMVKEFKEASDDDVKRRVAERLEADRQSDNSLIRYYAVRAMTTLDTELFADALQAATNDEDATVRAIATKALNR